MTLSSLSNPTLAEETFTMLYLCSMYIVAYIKPKSPKGTKRRRARTMKWCDEIGKLILESLFFLFHRCKENGFHWFPMLFSPIMYATFIFKSLAS